MKGMEPIRYRPAEAIVWLRLGAEEMRKEARRRGQSVFQRQGERTLVKDLRDTAGALFGMGKSAFAEFLHQQYDDAEYVLYADRFEVVGKRGTKSILYEDVVSIRQDGDRAVMTLKRGSHTIKPIAHIVAGHVRVPIGWSRNGMDVPYETLLDELSARCRIDISYSS